jgi:hypothetical protein
MRKYALAAAALAIAVAGVIGVATDGLEKERGDESRGPRNNRVIFVFTLDEQPKVAEAVANTFCLTENSDGTPDGKADSCVAGQADFGLNMPLCDGDGKPVGHMETTTATAKQLEVLEAQLGAIVVRGTVGYPERSGELRRRGWSVCPAEGSDG